MLLKEYLAWHPYLEAFAFNYKNNTFLYRCDERYGNSFFKYESKT